MARGYYHLDMETVTFKLDRRHIQRPEGSGGLATGRSQAAVVRELIDRHLGRQKPSLHDRAKDLCGSIAGAEDLSSRRLEGYGRD